MGAQAFQRKVAISQVFLHQSATLYSSTLISMLDPDHAIRTLLIYKFVGFHMVACIPLIVLLFLSLAEVVGIWIVLSNCLAGRAKIMIVIPVTV